MKKNYLIFLSLILFLAIILLVIKITGSGNENETSDLNGSSQQTYQEDNNVQGNEGEDDRGVEKVGGQDLGSNDNFLNMQGYYLQIPPNYNCQGGFTDGYRYLDAKCSHVDREDYRIVVEPGLAATSISDLTKFIENQLVVRSFEFTGGVYNLYICDPYFSEDLKLGAEHYVCEHSQDGKKTFTMGTGKAFSANNSYFARWFESHLIIEENDNDYIKEDYINVLTKFLNSSIDINWEDYNPENL